MTQAEYDALARQATEKTARDFAELLVRDHGVKSALARARRLDRDRAYRHHPKWLARAIEILTEMEAKP